LESRTLVQAPKQDRSRRTLNRILQAASDLIAEQGVEETTIHQIVDQAGSSVGSFYARFKGKDDLLDYLEHRAWEDARSHWEQALNGTPLEELSLRDLGASVVSLLHESSKREAKVRRALQQRRGVKSEDSQAGAFGERVVQDVQSLLVGKKAEIGHPDPELAVTVGLQLVMAGLPALQGVDGLSEEQQVSELTRALMAYLGSDQEGPAQSIDFFDVWA
jgi:AcrR family transcriptional regulator